MRWWKSIPELDAGTTLAGKRIKLDQYEMSPSLAVHPQADRFVLGTDWNLWNFGKDGRPLWRRSAPASVLGGGGTPSRLIGAAVLW